MTPKVKHLAQKQVGSPLNFAKRQKPSFSTNFRMFVAQTRFDDTFAHQEVKAKRIIHFKLLESINFSYLSTFEKFGWTS